MSKKELLIAAIFTFITIAAWVIFDIIHARAQVEIPQKTKEVMEPISPDFNTQVLQENP